MRGFTTVRDVGGADAGLKYAQAEGIVTLAPAFVSGKGLSQTGGITRISAARGQGQFLLWRSQVMRRHGSEISRWWIASRHADLRDELRRGADQLQYHGWWRSSPRPK